MGFLVDQLDRLRETISELAAFQTWTGSADATEALDHVHQYYAEGLPPFPLAVVNIDSARRTKGRIDDAFFFESPVSGTGTIEFMGPVSTSEGQRRPTPAQMRTFDAAVEGILAELEAAAPKDSFEVSRFAIGEGPIEQARANFSGDGSEVAPELFLGRSVSFEWRGD